MAVRWGAGEEILTTCNMEFFPLVTLDETTPLHSAGHTLEALEGCLDPSILSIFEDTPAVETRGLDNESEATLLTALTEILDNVDDENLSPFDTLPDSDLLSGQKGREHSSLRRLFSLPHSPPEKDMLYSARPPSTGKTLPRIQPDSLQRSDGEEEEDNSSLESSPNNDLLGWEGFPITFEQGVEDGVSMSLGDVVRHMHPYCMAFLLEDDKGEQMLPEGGILLEVVDQGENGEPILAIPEMEVPMSVKLDEHLSFTNPKFMDEAEDLASDSSEHIVVDDEDIIVKTPLQVADPDPCLNVKMQKKKRKEKSPSQRKKKKNLNGLTACPREPMEGRVLRSASLKEAAQELPKKAKKRSHKDYEKNKTPQVPTATPNTTLFTKPKDVSLNHTKGRSESAAATTILPLIPNTNAEMGKPGCSSTARNLQQPEAKQKLSVTAAENLEGSDIVSSAVLLASQAVPLLSSTDQAVFATPELAQATLAISEPLPSLPPVTQEPKPKSLSLAEYRRLRQKKKPAPVEKLDDNSTKWPSLPELPKELPPIPCLPDPSPRDPRLSRPQSAKKSEEVKSAWQPRGPGAPPTPEALLVPPAYIVASSKNISAAAYFSKPQQTPAQTVVTQPSECQNSSDAAPKLHEEQTTKGDEKRVTEELQSQNTSATTTTEVVEPTTNVLAPTVSHIVAVSQNVSENTVSINSSEEASTIDSNCQRCFSPVHVLESQSESVMLEVKRKTSEGKSPTRELIEEFTSEMGIEAVDLTSLLEQFEETQAKEEQCVPEVCGRAAAVGNSSTKLVSEKMVVERVRANDLSSIAALTPPATPPHLIWKPLAPVALLGKSKTAENTKSNLSKVIEIEARPLPSVKTRNNFFPAAPSVAPGLACKDHDYCLSNKDPCNGEPAKRWNVKQHSSITIKPINKPTPQVPHTVQSPSVQFTTTLAVNTQGYQQTEQLDHRTDKLEESSVVVTPDASPVRQDADTTASQRRGPLERSYRQRAVSHAYCPKERSAGRSRIRRSRHSPSSRSNSSGSDSSSSRSGSRSCSPPKKRYRPCHSRSSSSSSSGSSSRSSSTSVSRSPLRRRRYSYSSSRSGSWSRSRSRSYSPQTQAQRNKNRRLYSPSYRPTYGTSVKTNHELRRLKEKAIEERRVVYVGRICSTMTQKELKERFSYFGEIEECTLHFRDRGDNYGFVTYYNTNDAFMAIENGSKLRKPDELPFDLCFGGRRQFCQSNYADLDSNKDYEPLPTRSKYHALDFDTLLKQAQQNLKR